MIPCICIDDKNKPNEVPANKWVKKGKEYNVIYTTTVMPQKQLALHLYEIELDETCAPYEYFLARRFAFTYDNMQKLMQMIEDCSDIEFTVDELMKETTFETT